MNDQSTGAVLLTLKDRADLTLEQIADGAGYSGKSSVQEYFKPEFSRPLAKKVAEKLAEALVGRGNPPIAKEEILALAGAKRGDAAPIPPANAQPVHFEGASAARMTRDLPIYGTGLGGELDIDGEAIEQTSLNTGEIIEYARRPTILDGRADVYGLYVQGSSMVPVHAEGALVLVEKRRPPRVDDDVVVYLRVNGEADFEDDGESARRVLIKRLVRRSASYVELRQFNPDITFRIAARDILRIERVLTLADLLG